jgi:hypothetical protein
MWRPGKRQIRRIALALLLPALMFRAAIPAGYMPVASAGQPTLVMCSAVHVASHDSADKHDPDSTRTNLPCVFAASSAAPPVDPAGALVIAGSVLPASRIDAVGSLFPAIIRAQSARAPPISPYA